MCKQTAGLLALLGRVAICAIFFLSAVANKIPNFQKVSEHMADKGIPAAGFALALAIALILLGSISVVIGFKARWGALLLLVFLVLATFYFHDFWNMDGESLRVQQIMFMKNLSLAGTMLLIMAMGAGPWSMDECCGTKTACAATGVE